MYVGVGIMIMCDAIYMESAVLKPRTVHLLLFCAALLIRLIRKFQ